MRTFIQPFFLSTSCVLFQKNFWMSRQTQLFVCFCFFFVMVINWKCSPKSYEQEYELNGVRLFCVYCEIYVIAWQIRWYVMCDWIGNSFFSSVRWVTLMQWKCSKLRCVFRAHKIRNSFSTIIRTQQQIVVNNVPIRKTYVNFTKNFTFTSSKNDECFSLHSGCIIKAREPTWANRNGKKHNHSHTHTNQNPKKNNEIHS